MSIASSPDYLLRPEDQAFKALFPSVEDSNTFDEFFNEGLYDLDADSDSKEPISSLDDFSTVDANTNEYPRLPSLPESTVQSQSPPQPWRKGLWCLNQGPSLNISVGKTRRQQLDQSSSAHLLNNENLAIRYPRSPPTSPTAKETKRFLTSLNAAPYRNKGSTRLPQSREATLSPSPMYAQLPVHAKMEQIETWQQDFQNFNLRAPHERPAQLTGGTPQSQYAQAARHANAAIADQNAAIGLAISNYEPLQSGLLGTEASVAIDPNLVDQSNNFGLEALSSPHHHPSIVQHNSFDQLPTPVWTTESLHSSSSSHQSYDTLPPSVQSTQSGQSTHDIYKNQMQSWWSPPGGQGQRQWATNHQAQHTHIAAPMQQRNSAQLLVQNFDRAQSGLGIQYPELEQMEQAVFQEPNPYFHNVPPGTAVPYSPLGNVPPGTAVPYSPLGNVPHGLNAIPPLPMPPSHNFSNFSPFTTPRKTRRSPSRSPSPCISPTIATPRALRQRSPTRSGYEHAHHRRKSIHKSGPIKDMHEPLPHIATSTRSRSRSTSKAPRTPRTPKTPTGGFGAIDFVNFTPKDSRKLLSDVAPSGSSKTRARREAEARDKRKKLGEAALKAVSRAGGDVEALKKAIRV